MSLHQYAVKMTLVSFALLFSISNATADDYRPHISDYYYWYTGDSSVKMLPASTHICVLTRVAGNFRGSGERLAVRVYNDGYWYLEGTATQDISGLAVCFSRSMFKGRDNWLSSEFTSSVQYTRGWGIRADLAHHNSTDLWWGDAASILNGIGGRFAENNDGVRVFQNSNGFASSVLHVSSGPGGDFVTSDRGYHWGLAYSYFVGVAHSGQKAKFIDRTGNTVSGGGGHFGSSSTDSEPAITVMAPVDKGMCYFTGIGPTLSGNNFASIEKEFIKGVEHWVLKTIAWDPQAGAEGGHLAVGASCFAFDQQ